jgi:hypothetical protein
LYRFFGALAIFCGWLSIPVGAVAGLMASQFFDSGRVQGAAPPIDVYGVSVILVFWIYSCVTILTALPLLMAAVASDPRRPLRLMAAVMGILGVLLLPSELGRAFGLPIVAGGAGLWIGSGLVYRGGNAAATNGAAGSGAQPSAPTTTEVAGGGIAAGGIAAGGIAAGDTAAREIAPMVATGALAEPEEPTAADELATDSAAGRSGTTASAPTPAPAGNSRGGRRPAVASKAVRTCPWCSTVVSATGPECANCGAALAQPAAEGVGIPGLTEVPAELRRYAENARSGKRQQSLLKMIFADSQIPTAVNAPPPSDIAALRPPSPELRAEMARFDAEIAAAAVETAEPPTPEPAPPGAGSGT